MKRIYVDKPFRLRTSDGVREFGKGAHSVDDATADYWAMKAWLAEGRYRVAFTRPDGVEETPFSEEDVRTEEDPEITPASEAPATTKTGKA